MGGGLCVGVNITGSTNPATAARIYAAWNLISIKGDGGGRFARDANKRCERDSIEQTQTRGISRLFRRQARNRSAMNYLGVTFH